MKLEMNMSIADRRRLIADFELAEYPGQPVQFLSSAAAPMLPKPEALIAAGAGDESNGPVAAVVETSLLAFGEEVSAQNRKDIMDCFQYATLRANKLFAAEIGGEQWYGEFRGALNFLGLVSWNWGYSRYQSLGQTFTMDQAALDILKSAITAAALPGPASVAMLKVAADAIATLQAKDEPLRLFERQVKTHDGASFNIGTCSQSPSGTVQVVMGAVSFSTDANVTNVLFWEWNSTQVNVYRGEDKLVLNAQHYEGVREDVRAALQKAARNAIAEFEI